MSVEEQQPQVYNLKAGLTMFHNQVMRTPALDGTQEGSIRKESTSSNNSPPVKSSRSSSNSSTTPTAKLVGSNKFVIF
jgi:hypothetical protein